MMREFFQGLLEAVCFFLGIIGLTAVSFVLVRIVWYMGVLILP